MMRTCMMLALVIHQMFLSWVPAECVHSWATLSLIQKKRISIVCKRCCLTALFAVHTVVVLLQCTGVLDCLWPIASSHWQNMIPVWQLWYKAPSSASAADATMNQRMFTLTWNAPLIFIGSPSFGIHPMKIWPHVWLWALASCWNPQRRVRTQGTLTESSTDTAR